MQYNCHLLPLHSVVILNRLYLRRHPLPTLTLSPIPYPGLALEEEEEEEEKEELMVAVVVAVAGQEVVVVALACIPLVVVGVFRWIAILRAICFAPSSLSARRTSSVDAA